LLSDWRGILQNSPSATEVAANPERIFPAMAANTPVYEVVWNWVMKDEAGRSSVPVYEDSYVMIYRIR